MMSGDAKIRHTKRCAAAGSLNVTLMDRIHKITKVLEEPVRFSPQSPRAPISAPK